jgi:hypothetical protein
MSNDSLLFMILTAFVSITLLLLNTIRQNSKIRFMEFVLMQQDHTISIIMNKIGNQNDTK